MSTTTKLSASYVVIGVKEKIGYGLGDFASNLSFGFVSLFLLFFILMFMASARYRRV
ncbi:Na+/melibiose symporter-like transporter [Klebsiella aerogenes]